MARQKPRGYQVRIDPEIWVDQDLADSCSRTARFIYIDSLFYLAAASDPDGMYPHAQLVREVGVEALRVADQLIGFGVWQDLGLGYRVLPRSGCCVVPERRAAIPAAIRRAVMARDHGRCVDCGATDDLALDHIYPWSLGGPDTVENLRVLCRPCNSSKGARILP